MPGQKTPLTKTQIVVEIVFNRQDLPTGTKEAWDSGWIVLPAQAHFGIRAAQKRFDSQGQIPASIDALLKEAGITLRSSGRA